jgi:DNA-binding SARP family transcriptional activator/tetratricopeptide (TPR) repeat protein
MLHLRTLGGLTIQDEKGPLTGAITRKRSLALLALIGLATEQGLSRDRVLAYLWPESDTERARNNLKQTLFQLRQELSEDLFAPGVGVLRLETSAISVDACDFQAALDRANPTTAVTLYRGPFLDGFYLPGLAEFERWVESERVSLAHRYAGALEAMAGTAARRGDHHRAADWWRRLAAHDPLSARNAVGLMRALTQAGDRTAALEHARTYEELVRGEFESDPDPEVTDLARQLRGKFSRWTAGTAPKTQTENPSTGGNGTQDGAPSTQAPPVAPRLPRKSPVPPATPTVPAKIHSRPRWPFEIALSALLLAGAWWWARHRDPGPGSPDLVAVFPFTFSGAGEPRFVGDGTVELLSASLDGAGQLRSVHPSAYLARMPRQGSAAPLDPERARGWANRLGAELYVLGDIVATKDRVQISAAMYDRGRSDAVAHSSVEGDTAELFQLVDRLAADLIASRYGKPRERLTRVAAVTTASLPALKAYLGGESAYREGHYPDAIEGLQKAVGTDSTFALAYYRLSDAAQRAGRPELARSSAEQALRYRERLGERERRLIEAQHAWRLGRGDEAERLCRSLVADYPDDVEAWLQLGEGLVHGNPLRGRSSVEARPAFEQVLARDPDNAEALIHLARIASIQGKQQEADTLLRRARSAVQRPPTALEEAVVTADLEGSERMGRRLAGAFQAPDLQAYGHRMLAQAAIAHGQWRRAWSELADAAKLDSIPALELGSLFAAFSFLPLPQSEIIAVREAVRRWDAGAQAPQRLHLMGLLDARLGDTTGALRDARVLARAADSSLDGRFAPTLAASIRAHVAAVGGRDREALADLDAAGWEAAAPALVAEAYDRYFRAELLERAKREDEALGWLQSIAERSAYELVYLAPSHLRQAEIYQRRNQRDLAAQHYRRFIELWREADPELQPVVAEARSQLATLESGSTGSSSRRSETTKGSR